MTFTPWEQTLQVFPELSDWILLLLSPVLMHLADPRKGVKVVMVLSLGMFFVAIINLLYTEPRPFWVSSDVKGYYCALGYANPEYVLTMLTTTYFYTVIQYSHRSGSYIVNGIYGLGCVLVFLECLSGLYLGITFIHQLITTLCYSFLIVALAILFDHPLAIIAYRSAFDYNKNRLHSM
jgi:hypothetical protein